MWRLIQFNKFYDILKNVEFEFKIFNWIHEKFSVFEEIGSKLWL